MEAHQINNETDIPNEIVEDVLSISDPATICRSKSLSRYWKQVVTGNDFVMRHKERLRMKNDVGIILQREHAFNAIEYRRIDQYPGYRRFSYFRLEEYLAAYDSFMLLFKDEYDIVIKNPTTNSALDLPFEPIQIPPESSGCYCYFGLGYDWGTNDFYVLRISVFHGWRMGNEVKLFTRNTNAWIEMPVLPFVGGPACCPGCYLNGAFHWIVYGDQIAVFTVSTGSWSTIDKPTDIGQFEMFNQITCLDGKTLLLYQSSHLYGEELKFYVMEEYPLRSSWKRISVEVAMTLQLLNRFTMQPLYVIEPEKDRIFFRCNPLDRYGYVDLVNKTFVWTTEVPLYRWSATAFPYYKSLESVN